MKIGAYSDKSFSFGGITLNSCGHIHASRGRKINRPAGREDWLLFYIAEGTEKFFLETEVVADDGDFIIFPPGKKQENICLSQEAKFYYVHFPEPKDFSPFGLPLAQVISSKPSAKICGLFEEMLFELRTKSPKYEEYCIFVLMSLFALLSRRFVNENSVFGAYVDKIALVASFISTEYSKSYSLGDYAKMANMSKFHFLRVFESITGSSPIEYRNRIRIENAKELLDDTTLPISEIGSLLGFSSAAYFCDAFKKVVGISPAKYRKKAKG